ncbi:MAG: four helix bundle protein [Bacteroidetes bacterium]|nr:four helix bundle protein [Bacteroidota bacterium]MBS1540982.1 four helix bundle protein [Bacteroidota bacterium]
MERRPAQTFRDLIVWQMTHQLVLNVHAMTQSFPKEEIYGLTSQIRRSSVSVAANIVEGFKKKGKRDKLRFMNISQGSLAETMYYLILVNDLNYFKTDPLLGDAVEVEKILESYRNAFNK